MIFSQIILTKLPLIYIPILCPIKHKNGLVCWFTPCNFVLEGNNEFMFVLTFLLNSLTIPTIVKAAISPFPLLDIHAH